MSLLPHSGSILILSWAENLASSSLQDGATKWYYFLQEPTRPDPTRPDQTTQSSFSFNVVRCPNPNCYPHQQSMCGVPPPNSSHNQESMCRVPPCSSVPLPVNTDACPWNINLAFLFLIRFNFVHYERFSFRMFTQIQNMTKRLNFLPIF